MNILNASLGQSKTMTSHFVCVINESEVSGLFKHEFITVCASSGSKKYPVCEKGDNLGLGTL